MDQQLQPSAVVVLLQTHGFDLMAQVEAAGRCVRNVQSQIGILKESHDDTARADALHGIRESAADCLIEIDGFSATLREVQTLAAQLSPERRRTHQFVMWDRRRRPASIARAAR
jgi:hypothetical protein